MSTNAITLLTADQEAIQKLLRDYQALVDDGASEAEKAALSSQICRDLRVHLQLKEEILYPAIRRAIPATETAVELASVRAMVEQIERMSAGDDVYDAKLALLAECLDERARADQTELFPKVEEELDVDALETVLEKRKRELLQGAAHASRF